MKKVVARVSALLMLLVLLPGAQSHADLLHPNIVYIVSDDQRWDSYFAMPILQAELQAKGVTLSQFLAVSQPCCPSRSTVLTGLYAHSHHVYNNGNGWRHYVSKGWENDSIGLWMQGAGYQTGFFGKYLNGYREPTHVPPGWTRWVADAPPRYYDSVLSVDGVATRYGHDPRDYSTNLLGSYVTQFISSSAATGKPFFVYFAPDAPHLPAIPFPGDEHSFDSYLYRGRSYDEADVSDKPRYITKRAPLEGSGTQRKIDRHVRSELSTLPELDRVVGRVVQALADAGQLSNTLIMFTSDNGMMWGEHRIEGKAKPYVESVLLPFVARWDGHLPAGATYNSLAGTVDLTKTWVDLAGATPGHTLEGVDMLPLLTTNAVIHPDNAMLTEAANTKSYCEVYSPTWAYILNAEHDAQGNEEEEYYDLTRDPYELDNRISDPAYANQVALGRTLNDQWCKPRPPGFPR